MEIQQLIMVKVIQLLAKWHNGYIKYVKELNEIRINDNNLMEPMPWFYSMLTVLYFILNFADSILSIQ